MPPRRQVDVWPQDGPVTRVVATRHAHRHVRAVARWPRRAPARSRARRRGRRHWCWARERRQRHPTTVTRPRAKGLVVVLCLTDEGPAAGHGYLVAKTMVAVAARCAATRARTRLIKALTARFLAWSSRRLALKAGVDGQARHQFLADDAVDKAEATVQTGQYSRWRRRVDAVWLPGGPGEDTKRCARTRAWTVRLSALTHFAPTFEPRMSRPDRACLFGSGR
jgi:hypothetical protein